MDFQSRVAAWASCYILSERAIEPWDVPAGSKSRYIRCETGLPIDDLLVGYSSDETPELYGHAFVQAKLSLSLESGSTSALASFLDQCVRQLLAFDQPRPVDVPWTRRVDPKRDRFVLVCGSNSSAAITRDLRGAVTAVRQALPGVALNEIEFGNERQKNALKIVNKHLEDAWSRARGTALPPEELRQLLSLIRIHMLPVGSTEPEELRAQDILRNEVLKQRDHAGSAWNALIVGMSELSSKRSGADLPLLQSMLAQKDHALKPAESARVDIERIKLYSNQILESLRTFCELPLTAGHVTIERTCVKPMFEAAGSGSFLILGEPGAGKSGALYQLAEELSDQGYDVVALRADRLSAGEADFINRTIGLDGDFLRSLRRWPGEKPGFLLIDALDAARSEASSESLQDLIRMVRRPSAQNETLSRPWHVIASVREFDLRYAASLQDLFEGKLMAGEELVHPTEFKKVRHLYVQRLNAGELEQVWMRSPDLKELYQMLPPDVQPLFRNPFYLSLAAQLLTDGATPAELGLIRSQMELLDRYWKRRILSGSQRNRKEALLRRIVERMVELGAMRILRRDVEQIAPMWLDTLDILISDNVLTDWPDAPTGKPKTHELAFPHHILFDAAVERLVLRVPAAELALRLASERPLVLAIHPSLLMHFHHRWEVDDERRDFWDAALRLEAEKSVPEIAKIIGSTVAAERLLTTSDVTLLLTALKTDQEARQKAATQALQHLIGAAMAIGDENRLIGETAAPWSALAERASAHLSNSLVPPVLELVRRLTEKPEFLTAEQRSQTGAAARNAFRYMMDDEAWGPMLHHPLRAVCRTFKSDPVASAEAIRCCLQPAMVQEYGYLLLPRVAWEIGSLIQADTRLVEEIYNVVFSFEETSEETTGFGTPVLPLSSHRAQDFSLARYELNNSFLDFVKADPDAALRALLPAIEHYVTKERRADVPPQKPRYFDFQGRTTGVIQDWSVSWDDREQTNAEPYAALQLLDSFDTFLHAIAGSSTDEKLQRQHFVEAITGKPRHAVWWRRLIQLATAYPRTYGQELKAISTCTPLLASYDTYHETGRYLEVLFSQLEEGERRAIEVAILSLPDHAEEYDLNLERVRDVLLVPLHREYDRLEVL
jgi:hypothetical protein